MARVAEQYKEKVVPALIERFGYKSSMSVPRLSKIVVNMGVGKATEERKRLESAMTDMTILTGQKGVITKARKPIAGFKVRKGNDIGCMVTLRKQRMYEFFDRLISIAIPRIRDFRGLSSRSLDGGGNFSMGLHEQVVFPEISVDKVEFVQGMDITIVTTSRTDEEALALLELLGMPFRK
ncbi:MAG: 50S ribosomal protein L5 [Planctomycetota bacterium]|nr:50S ribosomal protein L5 [Planctomycetota bacterium]